MCRTLSGICEIIHMCPLGDTPYVQVEFVNNYVDMCVVLNFMPLDFI